MAVPAIVLTTTTISALMRVSFRAAQDSGLCTAPQNPDQPPLNALVATAAMGIRTNRLK